MEMNVQLSNHPTLTTSVVVDTKLTLFAKLLQYASDKEFEEVLNNLPFAVVPDVPQGKHCYSYGLRFFYEINSYNEDDVAKHLGFNNYVQMCGVVYALRHKKFGLSITHRRVDRNKICFALIIRTRRNV